MSKGTLNSRLVGFVALIAPLGQLLAQTPTPTPTGTPLPTPGPTTASVPLSAEVSAVLMFVLAMTGIWYILRSKKET